MSTTPQQLAASVRVRSHTLAYRAVLLALITAACLLAASTYAVFGHTWDEPEHLAAGVGLIDTGEYQYDAQHPPLARIAMAIGPYLAGARSHGNPGPSGEQEGRDILYDGMHAGATGGTGNYDRYLTLARIGMLPFLVVLVLSTWLWSRHTFGTPTAIVATALTVTTPVIIGHAAVAALDIPMVGTTMLALYLLLRWFEELSLARALAFGVAAGCAAGTKLSAIPFIGCVAITWTIAWLVERQFSTEQPLKGDELKHLTARLPSRLIGHACAAAIAALAALLLCYGPAFAPLSANLSIPVPAGIPRLIESLAALADHNHAGHLSYFMGELRRSGWWNFYLVALLVKTPLPTLLAALAGAVWLPLRSHSERRWTLAAPVLALAVILFFCSAYSHINIGVRHVLILFPLMSIVAGAFIVAMWHRFERMAARALIVALLGWQLAGMAIAHPDYLAYFNELAGSHPEKILIDSDLDWGQDLRRLEGTLQSLKVERFSFVYRGTADLQRENLPELQILWPNQRATGWIAVSLLARATGSEDGGYDWLNAYQPVMRVGKSIDLYFIEEGVGR